jgi:TPR repeat protein
MGTFKLISYIPVISGFGKHMYASGLFGRASGMYFNKRYKSSIKAYEDALNYADGMEDIPPFGYTFEQAYLALADMYENGLGVDKNIEKSEEYYLKAGSRGETGYEHQVATKSWYEKHWK